MNNKFQLIAIIDKIIELNYSPSGKPILNLLLKHESEQIEDGIARKVYLNIMAKVIGNNALIYQNKTHSKILAQGFLKTSKLGYKNVVFHISELNELNE